MDIFGFDRNFRSTYLRGYSNAHDA